LSYFYYTKDRPVNHVEGLLHLTKQPLEAIIDMMQKPSRLIIIGTFMAVLTSAVLLTSASAETSTTDAQIARIKSNCVSAKNTLDRVHANDALLRFNRGQIYESMTTKLMSRFNSRATSNNLDAKSLITITNSYGSALTTFRNDYQSYEEQLSAAIAINCTKEPIAFYDAVAKARTKRTQVHTDVVILNQYIDDYSVAFNAFAENFAKSTGGSN
jgi:hypothetical protein